MENKPESTKNNLMAIDRILHEPARTQISALLYVIESADFTFIMNQTGLTWGNLSAHLNKMEEAGYVQITKSYKGKRPNTSICLTEAGRKAFKEYAIQMRQFFSDLPV